MFVAALANDPRQVFEFPCRKPCPPGQQTARDKEKPVRKNHPAQARHRADYTPHTYRTTDGKSRRVSEKRDSALPAAAAGAAAGVWLKTA